YPIVFSVPGVYAVSFSCFIDGQPTILSGTITIVDPPQITQNQKPVLSVSKVIQTRVGQELVLPVSATDPDSNQQVTISVVKKPGNATFTASQLKWTPAAADTGADTVIFTATDNGSPALTATDSCIIVVIANLSSSCIVTFKSQGTTYSTASVNFNTMATAPAVPLGGTCDTFDGWYTSGTYTKKWDFLTDKVTIDTTLFAKWTRLSYVVTYNPNGAASGTAPAQQTKHCDVSLTLGDNSGNLTKTGYGFSGWNTTANGTGTTFLQGAPYTANASCALFALWKIDSLLVTFNSNDGSTVPSKMVAYGGSVQEPAAPTKAGSAFAGWYANQSLTTPFDFSTTITAARTLYAKWNPVYNVVYLANGGSGSVPVDNNEYTSGQLVTVLDKSGLTRQYYVFTGWNAASNGTGTNRLAGSTFQIGSKSDTLYANWKASIPVITTQPISVNPYPFDSISFSVAADGIGLSYQWYKDSILIPTTTSAAFAKQKVTYSDSGFYHCIVSNSSGSATSAKVKLAVRTTVKDADSNEYSIVVIGDQVWTAENLRTTRFNDGTSIQMVNDSAVWTNLTTPGYCFYYFTTSVNEQRKWGALYNWYTVNTGKLAPAGWHVPTDNDWETMEWYLSEHNLNWDNSGFAPVKGGRYDADFSQQGENGYWWTSTEIPGLPSEPPSNAWARLMQFSTGGGTTRIIIPINTGYSIRLVKN
ncbi:MAG: InlB B-repeat-containing protein, partial [Fibrobacterota bacterium]